MFLNDEVVINVVFTCRFYSIIKMVSAGPDSRDFSSCDQCDLFSALFLDKELDQIEEDAFKSHLAECAECRVAYNRERLFRQNLRQAGPIYPAPNSLRAQVESFLNETLEFGSVASVSTEETGFAKNSYLMSKVTNLRQQSTYVAVVSAFLVLSILWTVSNFINPGQSLTFAATAVETHQRYTTGSLPLELITNSPGNISEWFEGKVPFSLKLPRFREDSGQKELYWIKGARLIGYENDYAAYVAYEMGQHPISLVVTSSDSAKPQGGEKFYSKNLAIHYQMLSGFKVLTWSHHGLNYALVSDLEQHGQESCMVCHEGARPGMFDGELRSTMSTAQGE